MQGGIHISFHNGKCWNSNDSAAHQIWHFHDPWSLRGIIARVGGPPRCNDFWSYWNLDNLIGMILHYSSATLRSGFSSLDCLFTLNHHCTTPSNPCNDGSTWRDNQGMKIQRCQIWALSGFSSLSLPWIARVGGRGCNSRKRKGWKSTSRKTEKERWLARWRERTASRWSVPRRERSRRAGAGTGDRGAVSNRVPRGPKCADTNQGTVTV